METYTTNLFYVNYSFLKYGGLWWSGDEVCVKYKVYKIYQFLVILDAVILCPLMAFVNIIKNIADFSVLIEVIYIADTIFLSMVKVCFWLKNNQQIKTIMHMLERYSFYYEINGDFNPALILENAKKNGVMYSMALWGVSQITLSLTFGPPAIKSLWYHLRNMPITNVTSFKDLPVNIYVPFTYDTPLRYFFACMTQAISIHLFVNPFIGVDGLFMNLVNTMAEHMVILQGAFKSMKKRCLKNIVGDRLNTGILNSDELEERMMVEMKKCIRHLQMLFKCYDRVEEIFRYMCLYQAISTLFAVCCTFLLISSAERGTEEFRKYMSFLVGVIIQLTLYCWPGNELALKAENLPQALFDSDWLETRKPFKVCMLVTMMRLNRPLYLTAGKFVPLILSTQVSVLRGSYSYYAVLNSMKK